MEIQQGEPVSSDPADPVSVTVTSTPAWREAATPLVASV